MARIRHGRIRPQLAVIAGRKAGLSSPTPESVAECPEARDARDLAWEEYRRRLLDEETYTIEALLKWLRKTGVVTSQTAVHRDRDAARNRKRAIDLGVRKVEEFLEAARRLDPSDLFQAVAHQIGQTLFTACGTFGPERMQDMSVGEYLRLAEAVTGLMRAQALTEIDQVRLGELQRKYDDAVTAAQARTKRAGGRLADEELARIREAVFGSAA